MHVTIDIQRQMLLLFMDEPAACVVFASSVSSCSLLQIVKKKFNDDIALQKHRQN